MASWRYHSLVIGLDTFIFVELHVIQENNKGFSQKTQLLLFNIQINTLICTNSDSILLIYKSTFVKIIT